MFIYSTINQSTSHNLKILYNGQWIMIDAFLSQWQELNQLCTLKGSIRSIKAAFRQTFKMLQPTEMCSFGP